MDHAGGAEPLSLDLIREAIDAQNLGLRDGDVLMLHTAWCEWFLALTPEEKQRTRPACHRRTLAARALKGPLVERLRVLELYSELQPGIYH